MRIVIGRGDVSWADNSVCVRVCGFLFSPPVSVLFFSLYLSVSVGAFFLLSEDGTVWCFLLCATSLLFDFACFLPLLLEVLRVKHSVRGGGEEGVKSDHMAKPHYDYFSIDEILMTDEV